jgi:hypothetical protein
MAETSPMTYSINDQVLIYGIEPLFRRFFNEADTERRRIALHALEADLFMLAPILFPVNSNDPDSRKVQLANTRILDEPRIRFMGIIFDPQYENDPAVRAVRESYLTGLDVRYPARRRSV